jgi:hypothetical protein
VCSSKEIYVQILGNMCAVLRKYMCRSWEICA